MAVNAEFNWVGQQRVDIPHLKMIESAVRYDFDALSYCLVGQAAYVIKGFEIIGTPIGSEAKNLSFKVGGSRIIHPLATESGSVFAVRSDRVNETLDPTINIRMEGSCQPNSINYIGIDLRRQSDDTTADVIQILDPGSNTEFSAKLPLRRTLDYVWMVSQTDFTYNKSIAPIAIAITNAQNVITTINDARSLLGRLSPGGSNTNDVNPYGWPGGRPLSEGATTSTIAGDKSLTDLKTWMNAVMTRLWELGGSQYWYSLSADRNVHLHTGAAVFSSSGESFEIVSGNLHWQGLSFSFDNSSTNSIAIQDQLTSVVGLTDLADGECLYCDLDRSSIFSITPQKGVLKTLGGSNRPGQRWVIVSRIGTKYYVNGQPYPIGSSFAVATTVHNGTVKTNIDLTSANPVVATVVTDAGAAQRVVTGSGLSNNTDVGTAHTYTTSSDLKLGRGMAAGDDNILITTTGNRRTVIQGMGTSSYAYLKIQSGDGLSGPTSPGNQRIDSTPFDIDDFTQFQGTGNWNINNVMVLPVSPSYGAIKYFSKFSKTFRENCNLIMLGPPSEWGVTYDDEGQTLTFNSTGVTTIDGVDLIGDERICVNVSGAGYNGIYVCTTAAVDVETTTVLTRAIDAGGPSSATDLGLGFDIFDGVSVKIIDGTAYTNTYWSVNAPSVNSSIPIDGSFNWNFVSSDNSTSDQMAVMFWNGTYTVLCSSPVYPAL